MIAHTLDRTHWTEPRKRVADLPESSGTELGLTGGRPHWPWSRTLPISHRRRTRNKTRMHLLELLGPRQEARMGCQGAATAFHCSKREGLEPLLQCTAHRLGFS